MVENICNLNGMTMRCIEAIEAGVREQNLRSIVKACSEARIHLEKSRTAGQKLESRLAEYRKAFEALGFVRIKNGKQEIKVLERTKENFKL